MKQTVEEALTEFLLAKSRNLDINLYKNASELAKEFSAKWQSEQDKNLAIEFAEWLLENRWTRHPDGEKFFRTFSYKEPEIETSEQLFEKFMEERKH